jgi:hypothetical protein
MEESEMDNKLVVIKTDGTVEEVKQDKKPSLEQLQKIVGGYIEPVHGIKYEGRTGTMIVNEEGKMNNLPVNREATNLFISSFGPRDVIVGNVAILLGWRL